MWIALSAVTIATALGFSVLATVVSPHDRTAP